MNLLVCVCVCVQVPLLPWTSSIADASRTNAYDSMFYCAQLIAIHLSDSTLHGVVLCKTHVPPEHVFGPFGSTNWREEIRNMEIILNINKLLYCTNQWVQYKRVNTYSFSKVCKHCISAIGETLALSCSVHRFSPTKVMWPFQSLSRCSPSHFFGTFLFMVLCFCCIIKIKTDNIFTTHRLQLNCDWTQASLNRNFEPSSQTATVHRK